MNQCQGPGVKSKPAVGGKCGARSEGEGEGMLAIGDGGGDPSKSKWRGSPRRQPLAAVVRALLISAPAPLASTSVLHEDTSGVPKCKGLCRPIFEHKTNSSSGAAGFHLEPGAPTGKSALWLLAAKKIEVPAGGFVFLG